MPTFTFVHIHFLLHYYQYVRSTRKARDARRSVATRRNFKRVGKNALVGVPDDAAAEDDTGGLKFRSTMN